MDESSAVRVPLYARDGSVRAYTVIDATDAPLLGGKRWYLHRRGYAWRAGVLLHRRISGAPPGLEVDHINRDRLDNRRANLRLVPHVGNMQNTSSHRDSTSRFRGVSWWTQRRLWRATVWTNGRLVDLGCFPTEEEAAVAARAARLRVMPYALD